MEWQTWQERCFQERSFRFRLNCTDFVRYFRRANCGGCPLAILTCPGCGRGGLRVPDGRRGKVTCPTCGAEWFHPETVELSEVEFRCSKSGARFTVTSSRRSPLHKFIIKEIMKVAPTATRSPKESCSTFPQAVDPDVVAASSRSRATKMGKFLARIAARNVSAIPSGSVSALAPKQEPPSVTTAAIIYDASEYNWSGFACPYCAASRIIRCGSGHLVCDGTAEVRTGGVDSINVSVAQPDLSPGQSKPLRAIDAQWKLNSARQGSPPQPPQG